MVRLARASSKALPVVLSLEQSQGPNAVWKTTSRAIRGHSRQQPARLENRRFYLVCGGLGSGFEEQCGESGNVRSCH